jgi:hypothetical protein
LKDIDFKKNKLLYVEWQDAITMKEGWYAKEDVIDWGKSEDWLIKQVGYLIKENKKYILLATKFNPQEYGENKYSEITKIPKGWIKKRRFISSSSFFSRS